MAPSSDESLQLSPKIRWNRTPTLDRIRRPLKKPTALQQSEGIASLLSGAPGNPTERGVVGSWIEASSAAKRRRSLNSDDDFLLIDFPPATVELLSVVVSESIYLEDALVLTTECSRSLELRGSWMQCSARSGERGHIFMTDGSMLPVKEHYVFTDDMHVLFVLQPSRILSVTSVADSVVCTRKAAIAAGHSDGKRGGPISLVVGSLVHQVLQLALLGNASEALEVTFERVLSTFQEEIYFAASASLQEAVKLVEQVRDGFKKVLCNVGAYAEHLLGRGAPLHRSTTVATEQAITSFRWGMCGKLDATLQLADGPLAALEIKTGRGGARVAHAAQALLYACLLRDRSQAVREETKALLLYVGGEAGAEVQPVPVRSLEVGSLAIARNRAISAISDFALDLRLPPPIDLPYACNACAFQLECKAYARAESGQSSFSEFVMDWLKVIQAEEAVALKGREDFWTQSVEERVRRGKCIAKLSLVAVRKDDPLSSQWIYTLAVPEDADSDFPVSIGDPVLLSTEAVPCLFAGFVRMASDRSISISGGIPLPSDVPQDSIFVLDRDEMLGSFQLARGNLIRALEGNILPLLLGSSPIPLPTLPDVPLIAGLTEEQCRVIAVADQLDREKGSPIVCVQGMPGTGKSTTIVQLVSRLARKGRRVLFVAYTNVALDNVVDKLLLLPLPERPSLLRLGSSLSQRLQLSSLEQIDRHYTQAQVVACTVLGSVHPFVSVTEFDFCIMDEAAQILLPLSFIPVLKANRGLVLVGDHQQLAPTIRSSVPIPASLQLSLFAEFAKRHPECVIQLRSQFRMNSAIQSLANSLFYQGRLVSGADWVSHQRLPAIDWLADCGCCWLCRVATLPVAILDTAGLAPEHRVGDAIRNERECDLIERIVDAYLRHRVRDESAIGVITPYKAQSKFIASRLHRRYPGVEVATVDRYQGRDRDVILFSAVRSGADSAGDLLRDRARLCVALTRAKCQLVVVCDFSHLALEIPVWKEFYELVAGPSHSLGDCLIRMSTTWACI